MKGEFVVKFIKGVIEIGKEMHGIYAWERRNYTPLYVPDRLIYGRDSRNRKLYIGFKNLEHRRIIKKVENEGYKFTKKGEVWFRGSLLRYYKHLGLKWDNTWRVVIFDIPQELHNKRNRFRHRLKLLGLHKIQKSVFVFPYPCEEELARYSGELDISQYVNTIHANDLGHLTNEVKKVFNL